MASLLSGAESRCHGGLQRPRAEISAGAGTATYPNSAGGLENISRVACAARRLTRSLHSLRQRGFCVYRQYLGGANELKPRWKRCVESTDTNLGEALGK